MWRKVKTRPMGELVQPHPTAGQIMAALAESPLRYGLHVYNPPLQDHQALGVLAREVLALSERVAKLEGHRR